MLNPNMRLIIKLLLFVLVAGIFLPFFTLGPGGGPLLDPPELALLDIEVPQLPNFMGKEEAVTTSGSSTQVYRWRDSEGQIHYSSEPPPKTVKAKGVTLDSHVNVVPAVKFDATPRQRETGKQSREKLPGSIDPIYSPQKVKQLIDDAHDAQDLLNSRKNELDRQAGELER